MTTRTLSSGSTITILLSLGFFVGNAFGQQPDEKWKKFVSREGGYVAYFPGSWQELFPAAPTLEVVNFPPSERIRAVILPDNGASISVVPAPKGTNSIEQWISNNLRPEEQKSKNLVTLQRAEPKEQLQATEVAWQEDSTGVTREGIDCYFKISGHLFLARLEYWKANPNAAQYRRLLHEMAEKLSLL